MLKLALVTALLSVFSFPLTGFADTSTTGPEGGVPSENTPPDESKYGRTISASASDPLKEVYGKTYGILGSSIPLTFGPKLTVIGFPAIFRAGIEAKWDNMLGLGFDYGFIPTVSGSTGQSTLGLTAWNVAGRFYPWHRAFYVGLGLGNQTVTFADTGSVSGTSTRVTIDLHSTQLIPQIGWRWTWPDGFFMGLETGVQLPLSSGSKLTVEPTAPNNADYQKLEKQVNDAAAALGNVVLPHFALIQVGYFF